MNYIYHFSKKTSFDEIKKSIDENNIKQVVKGIVDISLYSEDRYKVHEFITHLLKSCQNDIVKSACIKACGHLVRIDGYLSNDIIDYIKNLEYDKSYNGVISDLKDDIEIYMK